MLVAQRECGRLKQEIQRLENDLADIKERRNIHEVWESNWIPSLHSYTFNITVSSHYNEIGYNKTLGITNTHRWSRQNCTFLRENLLPQNRIKRNFFYNVRFPWPQCLKKHCWWSISIICLLKAGLVINRCLWVFVKSCWLKICLWEGANWLDSQVFYRPFWAPNNSQSLKCTSERACKSPVPGTFKTTISFTMGFSSF